MRKKSTLLKNIISGMSTAVSEANVINGLP